MLTFPRDTASDLRSSSAVHSDPVMYNKAKSSPMLELMPQVRAIRPQCATNSRIRAFA